MTGRDSLPPSSRFRQFLFVALAAGMAACGDGDRQIPATDAAAGPALTPDASTMVSCEGQADGAPCSSERHCVQERCLVKVCGDGVVSAPEECDDGNQAIGDECTPSCRRPRGSCGDGKVDPSEECDDGNASNSDFCTTSCLRQLCRNGVLDLDEECDDGNTDPNDGCSNACQKVVCGDGMPEEQEECDDGNRSESDTCSNQCTAIKCGNSRLDPEEVCDGRLKSASGKPEGEPMPEGLTCAPDCKSVIDDRCKKCQDMKCRRWYGEVLGSPGDLVAGCYEVGTEIDGTVGDASFVSKCSEMVECVRRNRCDLYRPLTVAPTEERTWGSLFGCFCGETTPGSGTWDDSDRGQSSCDAAPAGRCVQQFYAASDCTTGGCVQTTLNAYGSASSIANFLALCQFEQCFDECR